MRYRNVLDVPAGFRRLSRRRLILAAFDQQPRALAYFARTSRADDSRDDLAIGTDEQGGRYRLDAKAVDQCFVRERDRIIHLEFFNERRDRSQPLTLEQVA